MMAKILVINDFLPLLYAIEHLLKTEGYDCRITESGEEGLDLLCAEKFDLLIQDFVRPCSLDGVELYRKMKADPALRSIPVLFVSGGPEPYFQQLRECGVDPVAFRDGYLPTPFHPQEMRKRVKQILLGVPVGAD